MFLDFRRYLFEIVLRGAWCVALLRCRWFVLEFNAYVGNETKPLSRVRKRIESNVHASPWSKWYFADCMTVQFSNFIDMQSQTGWELDEISLVWEMSGFVRLFN